METRARYLDRENFQGLDCDRYLLLSEKVIDNAADEMKMIAVSKRSIRLLPQKEIVRTDLQSFKQKIESLATNW